MRCKITIIKNGPYKVTGNVPLSEKVIVPQGHGYVFEQGRELPQAEEYYLCRCGQSENAPFCDGSHLKTGFIGAETASRRKYEERAYLFEGPGLDMLDDRRCAFGRFCHSEKGNAWELLKDSDKEEYREKAIKAACECPSGRLTPLDKTGKVIEIAYEPSIEVLQDPEKGVSAGLLVKGHIPIESADGQLYETRNRVVLCRCGKSSIKPFCDASHVSIGFSDKE